MIKKKRPETMIERIERAHHMYDNGPKPKHYGDKSIVDMEEFAALQHSCQTCSLNARGLQLDHRAGLQLCEWRDHFPED